MEIKQSKTPPTRILYTNEVRNDLDDLLGNVDAMNALGIAVNPTEVLGMYAFDIADTGDREHAYRASLDCIQSCRARSLN